MKNNGKYQTKTITKKACEREERDDSTLCLRQSDTTRFMIKYANEQTHSSKNSRSNKNRIGMGVPRKM